MAKVMAGQTVKQLDSNTRLPKDRYAIRVTEEVVKDSKSSGNPMIVVESEIVSPESIDINGESVTIAGTRINPAYYTIKNREDAEKDGKAKTRLFDYYRRLGIPVEVKDGVYFVNGEEFDDDKAPTFAKGKIFDAILRSDESVQLREPTAEQKAKGQGGEPIKGADGKPLAPKFYVALQEILGPSSLEVNPTF